MHCLRMIKGETPGTEFAPDRDVTLIGKGRSCNIVLADPHVSKRHARIERTPGGLYIKDLDRTNRTKVEGQEIKRRLEDGDLIKICGYQSRYVGDGARPGITRSPSSTRRPSRKPGTRGWFSRPSSPIGLRTLPATRSGMIMSRRGS